jgi:hypothetical protein
MHSITVVKKGTRPSPGTQRVYIGRPGALGNPFPLKGVPGPGPRYTRDESVDAYERWLREKIAAKDAAVCAELNRLYQLAKAGALELECFCAPLRCHGDVVRAVLLEKLR